MFSGQSKTKSTTEQIGEGSSSSSLGTATKKKKKFQVFTKTESDDSESENEVLENIAKRVVQKLTNTSPATNLWHSSLIPATATLTSAQTTPPLPFAIPIKKDDENDTFGRINIWR